jgi:hypothetical protein
MSKQIKSEILFSSACQRQREKKAEIKIKDLMLLD